MPGRRAAACERQSARRQERGRETEHESSGVHICYLLFAWSIRTSSTCCETSTLPSRERAPSRPSAWPPLVGCGRTWHIAPHPCCIVLCRPCESAAAPILSCVSCKGRWEAPSRDPPPLHHLLRYLRFHCHRSPSSERAAAMQAARPGAAASSTRASLPALDGSKLPLSCFELAEVPVPKGKGRMSRSRQEEAMLHALAGSIAGCISRCALVAVGLGCAGPVAHTCCLGVMTGGRG